VNRAFESAIRRDPANWFWVHNRWKKYQPAKSRSGLMEERSELSAQV
jgi:lauroyl/myristoyl acyltransferase